MLFTQTEISSIADFFDITVSYRNGVFETSEKFKTDNLKSLLDFKGIRFAFEDLLQEKRIFSSMRHKYLKCPMPNTEHYSWDTLVESLISNKSLKKTGEDTYLSTKTFSVEFLNGGIFRKNTTYTIMHNYEGLPIGFASIANGKPSEVFLMKGYVARPFKFNPMEKVLHIQKSIKAISSKRENVIFVGSMETLYFELSSTFAKRIVFSKSITVSMLEKIILCDKLAQYIDAHFNDIPLSELLYNNKEYLNISILRSFIKEATTHPTNIPIELLSYVSSDELEYLDIPDKEKNAILSLYMFSDGKVFDKLNNNKLITTRNAARKLKKNSFFRGLFRNTPLKVCDKKISQISSTKLSDIIYGNSGSFKFDFTHNCIHSGDNSTSRFKQELVEKKFRKKPEGSSARIKILSTVIKAPEKKLLSEVISCIVCAIFKIDYQLSISHISDSTTITQDAFLNIVKYFVQIDHIPIVTNSKSIFKNKEHTLSKSKRNTIRLLKKRQPDLYLCKAVSFVLNHIAVTYTTMEGCRSSLSNQKNATKTIEMILD